MSAARTVAPQAPTVIAVPVWAPPMSVRSTWRPAAVIPTTAPPTNQTIVTRVTELPTGSLCHTRMGAEHPVTRRVQAAREPGRRLVREVRVTGVAAGSEGHDPAAGVPVGEVPDIA